MSVRHVSTDVALVLATVALSSCITPIKFTDEFEAEWNQVVVNQPLVAQQYTYQQQQLAGLALGHTNRIRPYSLPDGAEFHTQWLAVQAQYPMVASEYMIQQRYLLDLFRSATSDVDTNLGFGRCALQTAVQQDLCNGGRDGLFIRQSFCLSQPFAVTDIKGCWDDRMRCSNADIPGGIPEGACESNFQKCLTKRPIRYSTVDDPVSAACVMSIVGRTLCEDQNVGTTIFAANRLVCGETEYRPTRCSNEFRQCRESSDSLALCYLRLRACLAPGDITVDGAGRQSGALPVHFYVLTDPTGQQLYPLGGGQSRVLYALFDTGTNKVRLNSELPSLISGPNFGQSDKDHLNVSPPPNDYLVIRLNGLARRNSPGGAVPFGPINAPDGAEAAVENVRVGLLPPAAASQPEKPPSLMGGPVINSVLALIDYTQPIVDMTGEPNPPFVNGVHMEFFMPGDLDIPAVDLTVKLRRFGNLVSADGVTAGRRYFVNDVTFRKGGNSVADSSAFDTPFDFLFDTATTLTLIADVVAEALGLVAGQGTFNCYGGQNNGYTLDSVVFEGVEGNYTVRNAEVCWQESKIISPRFTHAVIGANLFDQFAILVNGPADELGIIQR